MAQVSNSTINYLSILQEWKLIDDKLLVFVPQHSIVLTIGKSLSNLFNVLAHLKTFRKE
jgi:hypothetical protein